MNSDDLQALVDKNFNEPLVRSCKEKGVAIRTMYDVMDTRGDEKQAS